MTEGSSIFGNILKNSINNYYIAASKLYAKRSGEAAISSEQNSSSFQSALSAIQAFGKQLEYSKKVEIKTLCEAGKKFKELHEFYSNDLPLRSSLEVEAQECHSTGINLLLSINLALIDEFLELTSDEKEQLIADPEQANMIRQAIRNADLNTVRNPRTGDYLFHQLCQSKSKVCRQLAIECLNGGFDVNKQNLHGETGLHLAVSQGDVALTKNLLEHGADNSLKFVQETFNPMTSLDLALERNNSACSLMLCIKDPNLKVEGNLAPIHLIANLKADENTSDKAGENTSTLVLELLDNFSKSHDLNNYIKDLWKACERVQLNVSMSPATSQALEQVMFWMLSNAPKQLPALESQSICLDWLVSQVCKRGLTGPHDIQILEAMGSQDLLSLLPLFVESGSSPLSLLRENPLLPEALRKTLSTIPESTVPGEESFKIYRELSHSMKTFPSRFIEKIEFITKYENNIRLLKEKQFPKIENIERKIDEVTKEFRKELVELTEAQAKLKSGIPQQGEIHPSIRDHLEEYLIHQNDWYSIAKLTIIQNYSIQEYTSKVTYHLLMDKLVLPELDQYTGFPPKITSHALLTALNNLLMEEKSNLPSNETTVNFVEQLNRKLSPLLTEFIHLQSTFPILRAEIIKKRLQNMQPNENLLVPTACSTHATCLLVTKTGEETFKLTHYNTGRGLRDWHPQWKTSDRFQTYDIIDDVPKKSINNLRAWVNLSEPSKYEGIDPIYKIIHDILGKGGRRIPPSTHQEDYEATQASGTCAMQCLMAMLRHQCMQAAMGSPAEKEAVYKLIKTKMFIKYHQDNLPKVDSVIQGHLPSVVKKLKAEIQMVKIADDIEQFENAIGTMGELLNKFNREDIVQQLVARDSGTTMARYATLRTASTLLCGIWLQHSETPMPESAIQSEILNLALAKFEHHKAAQQNIQTRLSKFAQEQKTTELTTEFIRILVGTPYVDFGIVEIIKYLGNELPDPNGKPPVGMQRLLINFNNYRALCDSNVEKLADRLQENGMIELSFSVRNYWKEIAGTSKVKGNEFD